MDSENIFDDTGSDFLVLTNAEEQHSLWSASIDVPAGWSASFGPTRREECLEYITEHWTDMRPADLRQKPGNADTRTDEERG